MPWIKNAWQVAAHSSELTDKLIGRTLCDVPVVLYRTKAGLPVAMEDRCPHRLVPLSIGKKVGDQIQCGYHGIRFEPDGSCAKVPGQKQIPAATRVQTFPVAERYNLIWIWLGDASLADLNLIPDLHWMDSPDWDLTVGYLHFGCNYRLVTDNLLDLSHETYIHDKTIGNSDDESIAEFPVKVTTEQNRLVRAHREMPQIVPPPFFAPFLDTTGKIDRWQSAIYMPPGIHMTNVGFYPSDTPRSEALMHLALHLLTPETETSTHYFWSHCRNYHRGHTDTTALIMKGVTITFEEDKAVLELQQEALSRSPGAAVPNVAIMLDVAPIQGRRLLQRLVDNESQDPRAVAPPIPLTVEGPLSATGDALAAA
jgi:phenylpropionate dioxygenase-like ring-hydroxylating dioxygenase large terminal subunit